MLSITGITSISSSSPFSVLSGFIIAALLGPEKYIFILFEFNVFRISIKNLPSSDFRAWAEENVIFLFWRGRAGNLSDLSLEVSFLTPGLSLLSHEPVCFGGRKITGSED